MGQCVTGGLTMVEIRTSGQLRTVEGKTTTFSGASGLGGSREMVERVQYFFLRSHQY